MGEVPRSLVLLLKWTDMSLRPGWNVGTASNISGFGMSQKVGHLDFFPNGGKEMPGCQKNILSTIVDINGIWEGTYMREMMRHLPSWDGDSMWESLATGTMDLPPSAVSI